MSLTKAVPAAVPSYLHSPHPRFEVNAAKNKVPATSTTPEGALPGVCGLLHVP